MTDIYDYRQLPALMWFTSFEYRALPTNRVLTEYSLSCSSRACLGRRDRLSSACPVSLWSACWCHVIGGPL